MKTKLLLFALIISCFVSAQSSGTVTIYKITPNVVCPGDSIKLDFQMVNVQNNCVFQFMPTLEVLLQVSALTVSNYYPTETVAGAGICYYKRVKVPLTASMGTHTIYSNGNSNYPGTRTITVNNCATGIQEQNYELDQTPVYFDLQGNQINKKTNELIIEQVGFRRKKIFISL